MNEKKKRRPWRIVRTVLSLVVLVVLLVLAVLLIVNRDALSGQSLSAAFGRLFGRRSGVGSALEFDVFSENIFTDLGSGTVIVSDSCIQVVGEDGERVTRESVNLKTPAVVSAGEWALAWDIGGTAVVQIGKTGSCRQLAADGAIISASLSESGPFCLVSEAAGYKGAVSVYTEKGALCYQWFSGENYLVDADMAPSGERFAALTLGDSGCRVSVFALDDDEEKGSYLAEDEMFFDIEYLSDSRIALLSDTRLVLLNGSGEQVGEYLFDTEYLRDYELDGNGYALLLLGRYSTGSAARLVTVDGSGKESASLEITEDVLALSAAGRYITAVYPGRTVLYNSGLSERGEYVSEGVQEAVSRSGGSVILVTNGGAFVYTP